ncbi:TIR domain-containing protein, partial [Amycolatopsis sp. lyj-346]|uniref:toll/interleukin-1 receptor domain-containing protein n=1 Tax=Amycolatopsis sp. lyj-346 TaxID=2789289 RepID=UPI00397E5EBD
LALRRSELVDADADLIAEKLGDLPLAIEQAAAWLAETGMPARDYLNLLDEKVADAATPNNYEASVTTARNVSFDELRSRSSAAHLLAEAIEASATPATGNPTRATPADPMHRPGTSTAYGQEGWVFISYAHESADHKAAVARLCDFLEKSGVAVRFDGQELDKRRNWDRWINEQILGAAFVLVIASPSYLAAAHGTLPDDSHLGVSFEYDKLADLLHRFRAEWTRKILPVVLPGRSRDEIPLSFLPGNGSYYDVKDFTEKGAKSLLRVLRNGRPS